MIFYEILSGELYYFSVNYHEHVVRKCLIGGVVEISGDHQERSGAFAAWQQL